jgi:ribosomal protein S18 acetylase RimI-like enzyme
VEPALLSAGFEVEGRLPLMTYAGDRGESAPEGIELVAAVSEDELRGVATAQWEAYGESGPVPQRTVDGLRRTLEAGGLIVLARDVATGEPAGGGLCTGPYEGASELTSIGVREAFRRRGIAEAMTRRLAREMHARGNDGVFLMAAGKAEARIYERSGFATVSEILHISADQKSGSDPSRWKTCSENLGLTLVVSKAKQLIHSARCRDKTCSESLGLTLVVTNV